MIDKLIELVVSGEDNSKFILQDFCLEKGLHIKIVGNGCVLKTDSSIRIFGEGFDRSFCINDMVVYFYYDVSNFRSRGRIKSINKKSANIFCDSSELFTQNISFYDFIRYNKNDHPIFHHEINAYNSRRAHSGYENSY